MLINLIIYNRFNFYNAISISKEICCILQAMLGDHNGCTSHCPEIDITLEIYESKIAAWNDLI